eukprot:2016245-Pleurochrysis_carterae.AAC.1
MPTELAKDQARALCEQSEPAYVYIHLCCIGLQLMVNVSWVPHKYFASGPHTSRLVAAKAIERHSNNREA